jgi:hypothetical protein
MSVPSSKDSVWIKSACVCQKRGQKYRISPFTCPLFSLQKVFIKTKKCNFFCFEKYLISLNMIVKDRVYDFFMHVLFVRSENIR